MPPPAISNLKSQISYPISQHPRLADVRSWPVAGFRNYLIFYRPIEDGIDVLGILHGARNISKLLKDR